jgi:flagellar hook-basal body complex protein FliE
MNPLSAINAYVQPNGLITLLPKASTGAPIPAAELQDLSATTAPSTVSPTTAPEINPAPSSFSNVLGQFVGEVNAKQTAATDAVTGLISGQNVSLHQAMISIEEASTSFQLMVEVRNKLLDSYQEIMRMQV